MNEKKRKMIVYVVAAISLTWSAFNYQFDKPKPINQNKVEAAKQMTLSETAPKTNFVSMKVEQEKEWGRNPFRPWIRRSNTSINRSKSNNSNLAWIVGGILYSPNSPLAYINGQAVKTGDTINGATVIAIDKKTITLEHKGKIFTLGINKG